MPADNELHDGQCATERLDRVDPGAGLARPRAWVLALALAAAVTGLLLLAVGAAGAPCNPDVDPCGADNTPPQTTITAAPSGPTSDNTPEFSFTSNEAGSFYCQVDDGAPVDCSSPYTTPPLPDGPHTFSVTAEDLAGNVDPTPATRSFSVDATGPETTITAGPSGPNSDTTPEFGFSSNEGGSSFQCQVDNAAPTGCNSPYTTPALADGPHTLSVRATDSLGNADPTPATRSFTVDATPPQTTIDAGPSGTVSDGTPTFTFSSSESGSTFRCQIDAAAPVDCSSPYTTPPLGQGPHRVSVHAIDAAGNTDPTPATRSFTVDTGTPGAPELTIDSAPSGPTNDTTPEIRFHSSEADLTFRCQIDNDAPVDCSSPYTAPPLSEGPHQYGVTAFDAAGHSSRRGDQFTVDTTAPDTAITSGPSGTTTSRSASFGLSSSESGSTLECSLDGAAFSACSSPKAYTALANGTHVFKVRAQDAAGNLDASPAQRSWKVDATKPTVTTISPTAGKTGVATSANVLATFSEPMRASTIAKSTVKLVRKGTTKPLAATLTYDAARRRATLNPKSALARRTIYTATVSTGVKDAAGNPMARAKSWSFTVRR